MSSTKPSVTPVDPYDSHSMTLLHNRVRNRASSIRWNLNGLMFVYAILIIVIILVINSVDSLIVAAIAVAGLLIIWILSSIRIKRLEDEFFKQEILDYRELLKESGSGAVDNYPVANNIKESPLTKRELELLILMAAGKRNKEIANELNISEMTVKNHISHIFEKLEINDRIGAVFLALQNGWLKYDDLKTPTIEDS
ncbi:MAG: response regulator transcription factor [Dehalococcoidales bacterium]|nr:response regulator transcription factor [Dehalococcoidales bacterium]